MNLVADGPRKEQRKYPRRAIELPIAIGGANGKTTGHIQFATTDVSVGGAFIRSDLLFEVGEELSLIFSLPGGRSIRVRGSVVRVSRNVKCEGMGIEFVDLEQADRDAIRALVVRKA